MDGFAISKSEILQRLPDGHGLRIDIFDSVVSTNTLLREKASDGACEGSVIIAASQSGGRGRMGRSFESPSGSGLYMSLLLRPNMPVKDASMLTPAAAVAVCGAINELAPDAEPRIKWVNDIIMRGLKVCGILTEAASTPDGRADSVIVGVGVNVYEPDGGFGENVCGIAGAALDRRVDFARERLAAAFLSRFMRIYRDFPARTFIEQYRSMALIGRDVTVVKPSGCLNAYAYDIDDECRLLVSYADGSSEALSSGEIRVRLS